MRATTHVLELTDDTFDEVVAGADLPVLVEFTAAWCGPCRIMAPVLHELAAELDGEVVMATIDVDENRQACVRHGVMAMPTMVLFVDGKERYRLVGARGKGRLRQELAALLTG
jgi:thioredoxin 1